MRHLFGVTLRDENDGIRILGDASRGAAVEGFEIVENLGSIHRVPSSGGDVVYL